MEKSHFLAFLLVWVLFFLPHFHGGAAIGLGTTNDGSEEWGYYPVRPKAHMFWWYYKSPFRIEDPSKPWPTILWLQGGPGASGVGLGNFRQVGPLDTSLQRRNSTWLKVADLLFVDSPVGTGYSFVEDETLYVKSDEEAATDLTTLLIELSNKNENLQKRPLYIMAESYGGKHAVTLGLSALKAIETKKLKLILGGVVLGDSWISPEDYVASWGPLLKDVARLDNNGLKQTNIIVDKIKKQIANGQFEDAVRSWGELEDEILVDSNSVDFYNFLSDMRSGQSTAAELTKEIAMKRDQKYLNSLSSTNGDLPSLMNGAIKRKLKIIPQGVQWSIQARPVFQNLRGDYMKPRINEVDELLDKGVNVTIYNGQLDVICATRGTEAWVEKLKWGELNTFLSMHRTPLFCGDGKATKGFTKSYKNLHFYWILGAGHFVPEDQPCLALKMVGTITSSPGLATI